MSKKLAELNEDELAQVSGGEFDTDGACARGSFQKGLYCPICDYYQNTA